MASVYDAKTKNGVLRLV